MDCVGGGSIFLSLFYVVLLSVSLDVKDGNGSENEKYRKRERAEEYRNHGNLSYSF